ncbi:cyclic lactone autoinducer peptide [Clostridium autoethanogenum]|uniref:Cyclic lactone autoinducer peptide n=1 Tax=Clostridium autoethanogenum TaxID=84023 RepID=A0A3M0SR35_9CLOT|nr:cyclic lactone autoinducer peptide [Clostridium autoethanogenum]RMD00392.1 cyclic lactone autoinducer peptide [Clostridium autoethanogenum]
MKNLKESLLSKTMKVVGSLSLFLAAIVIVPTSAGGAHQPKCPDEFLK